MKLKENGNVPEIRFDYFKEEWDKKRFKDFTKLSQGLQIAISSRFLEDGEHRYFYITNEFLNPNSTKKYYIESPSENVICTVDDILMTRTGNTGKVITNISGAFHNNFFKVDYDKFETSKMFLYYLLTSNDIQKEIIIRAGNSTIPDLNHNDFYSIKTSVPALVEQSAIGSLFRTLDDLLASYKDNLANYQSLKASMLSKMFPKVGQTVPEIRLDGFEGGWEEKEFSKLVKRVTQSSDSNSLPKVEFEDIISGQGRLNKDISNKFDNRKGIHFEPGYTLYGKLRPYLNNWLLPKFEGVALGDFWVFDPNGNDSNFIYYLVQSNRYQKVANDTSGTKMPRSDWKSVSSTIFAIPQTVAEQQAIGAYFSNLDNLIAAHQEKISQLETLKKKLLQDMFI